MACSGGGGLGCEFSHHGWAKNLAQRPSSVMYSLKPNKYRKDARAVWESRMKISEPQELKVLPQTTVDSPQEFPKAEESDVSKNSGPMQPGQPNAKSSAHLEKDAQIELLKHAREKSRKWMAQATHSHGARKSASSAVDTQSLVGTQENAQTSCITQMYKQLASSRNRLSSRLSKANKYISFMERKLETSDETVQNAFECTEKVVRELVALSQMAQTAAAGAKFGVQKEEALEKLVALQKRITLAQEAVTREQALLDGLVPRRVPVSWYGVAMDVQLMGSFDNWTRGIELSAEDLSDSVLTEFTAELHLLPGTHEVKFVVNGEWKTAPDWPTVTAADGSTNNIIVIE